MDLEASIRTANAQLARAVRVAAIYSVGLGDMGQFVDRFQAAHADVRVHLEYLHPDRVYEKVREGTADLGLVSFPAKAAKLAALPWREEEMVLACSPVHPLAPNLAIRPSQLQRCQIHPFRQGPDHPPRNRSLPSRPRRRCRGRSGVRQHREHQESGGAGRRRGFLARTDPPPRSRRAFAGCTPAVWLPAGSAAGDHLSSSSQAEHEHLAIRRHALRRQWPCRHFAGKNGNNHMRIAPAAKRVS